MVQSHELNIWLYQNAEHGLFNALELRTPWKEPIGYFFLKNSISGSQLTNVP